MYISNEYEVLFTEFKIFFMAIHYFVDIIKSSDFAKSKLQAY